MQTSNQNIERKVLNLLLRFGEALDISLNLGLTADDFSTIKNKELFEILVDEYVNNNFVASDDLEHFINIVPYEDENEKKNTVVYLTKIYKLKVKIAGQVSEINIKMLPRYIDEMKRLSIVRRVISGVNRIQNVLLDEESDYRELMFALDEGLGNIIDNDKAVVRKSMSDAVKETIMELVDESENHSGIHLGINKDIDENAKIMTGYLTYIAGAPGIGKSAVLENIAVNLSEQGKKVLYVSLEMLINDNIKRIISMKQNIKTHKMQNPKLMDVDDWSKLDDLLSNDLFEEYGIMWLSQDNMTTADLRSEIEKNVRLYDIDVVLIDYYQLLKITTEYEMSDSVEIPMVSSDLRRMANKMYLNPAGQPKQVAIIALSQVVKDVERREDKRPTMQDLYYGGAKDARLVLGLFRDEYYHPNDTDKPNILEIGIIKSNNGIAGIWSDSYYELTTQKIRDLTDEEKELINSYDEDGDDEEYSDDYSEYDDEDEE